MTTGGGLGASASPLGDRYTVVEELGRGGFGQTYLAKDRHRYDELCVVKEFVPQVEDKAMIGKAKELFEREASVLYQLDHKQIPEFRQLLEVESQTGGRLFIVQDYVAGPTYQALLEDRQRFGGKFTETEITQLLYQLLPVLSYIHGLGLVHRDISPDTIILRQTDGLPVLIDFGGVKEIAASVRSQLAIEGVDPAPTRIGKVGYVPQEQLSTGNANPTSDLYGLAATLLVLSTGENPQMLNDPYHGVWSGYDALSPKLTSILKRMLAAAPEERFQTAEAVLAALKSTEPAGGTAAEVVGTTPIDSVYPPMGSGSGPGSGSGSGSGSISGAGAVAGGAAMGLAAGAMMGDRGPDVMSPNVSIDGISPGMGPAGVGGDEFGYDDRTAMAMADAGGLSGSMMGRPTDSAAGENEVYTPDLGPDPQPIGKPDPRQALIGLLVMLGLVGALLLLALTRMAGPGRRAEVADSGAAETDQQTQLVADGTFSAEESARRLEIRTRREGLGVSDDYFTALVNQLFYEAYPKLQTAGPEGTRKELTTAPADEPLRIRWDHMALTLLEQMEANYSQRSLGGLGRYSDADTNRWQSQINTVNVGTRSLFDLTDAKFFKLFPEQSGRDFLSQPVGQLYYAIADDKARAIETGSARQTIAFDSGAYRQDVSGQLSPGEGRVYTMALTAGQLLR
ncbi:MAG: serine/threonine-protein kinase, partial [Cyanobacteria bacterium J06597_16]